MNFVEINVTFWNLGETILKRASQHRGLSLFFFFFFLSFLFTWNGCRSVLHIFLEASPKFMGSGKGPNLCQSRLFATERPSFGTNTQAKHSVSLPQILENCRLQRSPRVIQPTPCNAGSTLWLQLTLTHGCSRAPEAGVVPFQRKPNLFLEISWSAYTSSGWAGGHVSISLFHEKYVLLDCRTKNLKAVYKTSKSTGKRSTTVWCEAG